MTDTQASPPEGYVAIDEPGSFIGHIGGLHWRKLDDRTETWLRLGKRHTNPIGTAHGGMLMTMMDITLGATVQSHVRHEGPGHPATIQLSVSMIGAAREGETVQGEARVDSTTRTMSFASGRLHVGGRTIATGTGVFRNPPKPDDKR